MFELSEYLQRIREGKIARKLADAVTLHGNCTMDLYKREVRIPDMDARNKRNRDSIRRLLANFSGSCRGDGNETVIVASEEFDVGDAFVRRLEKNIKHLIEKTDWLPNRDYPDGPFRLLPHIGEKGKYPNISVITIERHKPTGSKGLFFLNMKLGNFFNGKQPYAFYERPRE